MSKIVDESGLEHALDRVSTSAVYYSDSSGDIITPNTRCYTKAEIDLKLEDIEQKKLNKAEYDKTLEEVIKVTGYADVEEFSKDKSYYKGELVKRQEVDKNGEIIYRYYRFIQNHASSEWIANDVVESSFYQELMDMRSSSSEEVTLVINSVPGLNLSTYQVNITIDGGITSYPITSDPIVFNVEKGKSYSISFPSIEGYNSPDDVTLKALINQRLLVYNYTITPQNYETVTVAAKITSGANLETNATILESFVGKNVYVTIDDTELQTYQLNSTLGCTFNIEWGRTYSVSFEKVQGYLQINPTQNRVAAQAERLIPIVYEQYPTEVLVYADDGTTYTVEQFQKDFYNSDTKTYNKDAIAAKNFKAILITNSTLQEKGAQFLLPIKYTYNGTERYLHKTLTGTSQAYISGQWSTSQVEFDSTRLPYLNSWNGTTSMVFNGETYQTAWRGDINTQIIGQIIENSEGALKSPAYNIVMNSSLTINGKQYTPFLGAIAQWKTMYVSCYSTIQNIIAAVTSVAIDFGGGFWSSSQGSAAGAWGLSNGSVDGDYKASSRNVVPFFALSPQAVANY